MIRREVADEFADLVRQSLQERFSDDLVFDPIVVEPVIDQYGDEYLDTFIVYEGEYKKLDTRWTLGFSTLLRPEMGQLGIFSVPSFSYVPKDEGEEVFHCKHTRGLESYGPY